MSNIVEYVIKIREDGATSTVNRIKNQMRGLDDQAKKTNNTLASFRNALIAIGAVGITRQIINTVVAFERYDAILTNVLGSNAAAARTMEFLKDTASETSSGIGEVVQAYTRLASVDRLVNQQELRGLADLALSQNPNRSIVDLSEAIIDARVGELERLKEFNIRGRNLGDTISFSFKNVTTEVQNNTRAIEDYLISLGKLPGVAGINEKVLNTLGGQLAKLNDSFTFLLKEIGQELVPIFKVVANVLDDTISLFRKFVKTLKDVGVGFDGFVVALGAASIAAIAYTSATGAAAAITAALASPVLGVAAAVGALTFAFIEAYNNSLALRGALSGLSNLLGTGFEDLGSFDGFLNKLLKASDFINDIQKTLLKIPEFIGNAINTFFVTLGEGALLAINVLRALSGTVDNIASDIEERVKTFQDGVRQEIVRTNQRRENQAEEEQRNQQIAQIQPSAISASASSGTSSPSVVRSAAPRQFNINIENLVRQFTVDVKNNLTAGTEEVKEKIQQALLEAVADVEIARTF